jgi:hypothetical protein
MNSLKTVYLSANEIVKGSTLLRREVPLSSYLMDTGTAGKDTLFTLVLKTTVLSFSFSFSFSFLQMNRTSIARKAETTGLLLMLIRLVVVSS